MEDMKYNGFSAQPLESNEVKPLTQIPMEESVIEDRLISNEKGKEPEVVNEEENPKLVNAHKKRGRGRSLGSSNKINLLQVLASQGGIAALTMGSEFTPAVVIVEPGEDLVEKVWSLSKINGESVCIFSATGTISKVDLGHSIGGILKCEGFYEILYVKGSHVTVETLGVRREVAQLKMSIANAEGIVYGGLVCGSIIAAGKVQVIAGTFKENTQRKYQEEQSEPQGMSLNHPQEENSEPLPPLKLEKE
uniref:AT-hook motif nuclear-localized protein n=1 Tax=Nicotiana sylvestris TaxID=4096 RepID=A0A1U7XX11_NICSY|nr:PREDICTED: uncharacterized protein LOC104243086 [Nicotiana sylvestris]